MRVSDAMAFVMVDAGGSLCAATLRGLAAAFRTAGLPVVLVATPAGGAGGIPASTAATSALDLELLERGGVETLGPAELAIGLRGRSAFDASPLDALLRGLGV